MRLSVLLDWWRFLDNLHIDAAIFDFKGCFSVRTLFGFAAPGWHHTTHFLNKKTKCMNEL